MMIGNDKRIESCRKVGGHEKAKGHRRENDFEERWGTKTNTTYKPEADKKITNQEFLTDLRGILGPIENGNTSIKGGSSMQFTLGSIPELLPENKLEIIKDPKIFEKYLGKSESENPAHILCYRGSTFWIFFRMTDVIKFIVEKCSWRLLSTGRLKGDFEDKSSKSKKRAILTYEYRTKHKSYFLGASGGQGKFLIQLLKQNICYYQVEG
jgi:hypothetical protein